MKDNESASERLRRESEELRKIAADLMEHAAKLIAKSVELDKQIAKNNKAAESRKK
jgi:prefoldin subunit 5